MKSLFYVFLFAELIFQSKAQSCDSLNLSIRAIRASETDNKIAWELAAHQVFFNPICSPKNKLLLYLVGSYDSPNKTVKFPALAANNGYHVVILKYPNSVAAKTACASSSDANCFANFREEIITGQDLSNEVTVNDTDCIINRTFQLLSYLNQQYGSENWGQFLNGNAINWAKITVAGHSQGGGHAAYIAKLHHVQRAILFASPNDYSSHYNGAANWCSTAFATKDSALYGFNNFYDDVVPFYQQKEVWDSIGFGNGQDTVLVDEISAPFLNAHYLYTKYIGNGATSANHSSVVRDSETPLSPNGKPKFEEVWKYLLGITGQSVSVKPGEISDVNIYPNPFHNNFQVYTNQPIESYSIFNLNGQLIFQEDNNEGKALTVNLNNYPKGIYFISIQNSNHSFVNYKLIKE